VEEAPQGPSKSFTQLEEEEEEGEEWGEREGEGRGRVAMHWE
jgi:hypothetical protein